MNPVIGTRLASKEEWWDTEIPGAFVVSEDGATAYLKCPCGCSSGLMALSIGVQKPDKGPSWQWNGNREKPTLSPSIRDVGTCYFHGFLTDGVWTFDGDSGMGMKP